MIRTFANRINLFIELIYFGLLTSRILIFSKNKFRFSERKFSDFLMKLPVHAYFSASGIKKSISGVSDCSDIR